MSATLINLTGLTRSSETTYEMVAKTGAWKSTVVYYAPASIALSLAPAKYAEHPDNPSLLCVGCTIAREDGDVSKITASYEGLAPATPGAGFGTSQLPPPEFELSGTCSQEPIETHPKHSSLTAQDLRDIEDQLNNPDVNNTTDWSAVKHSLYACKQLGINSYYSPGQIYTKSYASYNRPSSIENNGKIDVPKDAPKLPSGMDWLKISTTYRRVGGYYQVQESWQASGLNGWDKYVYSTVASK